MGDASTTDAVSHWETDPLKATLERLPEEVVPGETIPSDEILDTFVAWAADKGLALYPAQEEAVFSILEDQHVLLATPTGSGKSLVATAFLYKALCDGKKGFYTCPIKALVSEKFFDLCKVFGAERVGLMTGDASVNPDAPIMCGTAEVLANMALRTPEPPADFVVMDEFHYYGDVERGIAWHLPLVTMPEARFLLMSATLGDTFRIERSVEDFTATPIAKVTGTTRPVPLYFDYKETGLQETISDLIANDQAPIYLVNFTQRAAAEQAQNLMSVDVANKEQKAAIKKALAGERFPSPYGKLLQKFLMHGIGVHHAGLLPRYRRLVERLAQDGLLKVISGTDTLGVGVNVPIRSVLFTQLCKFDGTKDRILAVREFQQIAGRAGRRGYDDKGFVIAQAPPHVIEAKKQAAKSSNKSKGQKKKKSASASPPKKGYVPWNKDTFDRLANGQPEALAPQFEIGQGLLLALLQSEKGDAKRGAGYRLAVDLIANTHLTDGAKSRQRKLAAQAFRTLRQAGLVTVEREEGSPVPVPRPAPDLQRDFSIHHTLTLYLLDALEQLDTDAETHAWDLLTLVESILENPRNILIAQERKAKTAAIEEMKAAGMEYEDRMEALEKISWPKPNETFLYETFNAFREKHPWVRGSNVTPKSITRDLLENYCGFHDYVRAYDLERTEGVLLQYLSETYKALTHSVPEGNRTPDVEDLRLQLEGVLETVDTSLMDEWLGLQGKAPIENLEAKQEAQAAAEGEEKKKRRSGLRDLLADGRALRARMRAEMHRLLGAMATQDVDSMATALRESPNDYELKKTIGPFFEAHDAIDLSPAARAPNHTTIVKLDDGGGNGAGGTWEITQRILPKAKAGAVPQVAYATGADDADAINDIEDEAEASAWALTCRLTVDPELEAAFRADPSIPLIELESVGE